MKENRKKGTLTCEQAESGCTPDSEETEIGGGRMDSRKKSRGYADRILPPRRLPVLVTDHLCGQSY